MVSPVLPNRGPRGSLRRELLGDDELPVIEHEEFTAPQSASQNVTITATITDDDAIFLAQIHYRTQVSTYFFTTSLNPQSLTDYVGSIPSEDLGSGGMHYYIEAVDTSGNIAVLPEGAPSEYFKFDLVAR